LDEQRAIILGFVISVLAGITVAIIITFMKREIPEISTEL